MLVVPNDRPGADLAFPDPEKVTLKWLFEHVPVKIWATIVLAPIPIAFSAGLASANLGFVQGLLSKPSVTSSTEFVSKAVAEKSTYVLGSGADAVDFNVLDVSVKRRIFKVEIGPAGGGRAIYEVPPNAPTVIPVGDRVYSLVVHDFAAAAIGQDIAVASFTLKRHP